MWSRSRCQWGPPWSRGVPSKILNVVPFKPTLPKSKSHLSSFLWSKEIENNLAPEQHHTRARQGRHPEPGWPRSRWWGEHLHNISILNHMKRADAGRSATLVWGDSVEFLFGHPSQLLEILQMFALWHQIITFTKSMFWKFQIKL